jgi:hypothetical protein
MHYVTDVQVGLRFWGIITYASLSLITQVSISSCRPTICLTTAIPLLLMLPYPLPSHLFASVLSGLYSCTTPWRVLYPAPFLPIPVLPPPALLPPLLFRLQHTRRIQPFPNILLRLMKSILLLFLPLMLPLLPLPFFASCSTFLPPSIHPLVTTPPPLTQNPSLQLPPLIPPPHPLTSHAQRLQNQHAPLQIQNRHAWNAPRQPLRARARALLFRCPAIAR